MPSRFIPINPAADTSQQVSIINKNFAELDAEGTIKLYSDKNGIPNISIGIQPDGTSRIKVAKPGIDVTKATDAQLAFNSAQNTLKIIATGLVDLPVTFPVRTGKLENFSETSMFEITHNLGFIPACLIYYANAAGGVSNAYFPFSYGSTYFQNYAQNYNVVYNAHIAVTSTLIQLGLSRDMYLNTAVTTGDFGTGTNRFKYILLQESIE